MKNIYLLIFCCLPVMLLSQDGQPIQYKQVKYPAGLYIPLHPWKNQLIDRVDILYDKETEENLFTATKPYNAADVMQYIYSIGPGGKWDTFNMEYITVDYDFNRESEKPLLKYFYHHPTHLYQVNTEEFQLAVNPLLHFALGNENEAEGLNYINSRGLELYGSIAQRVGFYTNIIESQAHVPTYVDEWIADHNQVFPGAGRTKAFKERGIDFLQASGYITVRPFKQLDIQFGQDKNFIGHGYRSLALSDFSNNYLFLKLNTRVWKLNYQNLFAELIDYRAQNIADGYVPRKYAAFHHLTFEPVKNLSFGLFETVVFGDADSTMPRQFELHYLNPLIFYRAVEFQLGSSDNVMIGMDWKWNFLQRFSFYGQVVIDDMIYWEFLKGTGWWGNKYGLQAGLKYINAFGIPHLDLQGEINTVTPYTYSHNRQTVNHTHFSQPLAHPLGANFREAVGIIHYQPWKKIHVKAMAIAADMGMDSDSTNWGGDIFRNNTTRERDYENTTGQGIDAKIYMLDFTISYMWRYNIFFDIRWLYRNAQSELESYSGSTNYIQAAFRMNLPQRNFHF